MTIPYRNLLLASVPNLSESNQLQRYRILAMRRLSFRARIRYLQTLRIYLHKSIWVDSAHCKAHPSLLLIPPLLLSPGFYAILVINWPFWTIPTIHQGGTLYLRPFLRAVQLGLIVDPHSRNASHHRISVSSTIPMLLRRIATGISVKRVRSGQPWTTREMCPSAASRRRDRMGSCGRRYSVSTERTSSMKVSCSR